jgi:hypothetical protein
MSFATTSKHWSLDGTILSAMCQMFNGSYRKSAIDLDGNFGNDNGSLIYGGRHFSDSASSIYLDGTMLYAALKDMEGSTCNVAVDLNDKASNSNGTLM